MLSPDPSGGGHVVFTAPPAAPPPPPARPASSSSGSSHAGGATAHSVQPARAPTGKPISTPHATRVASAGHPAVAARHSETLPQAIQRMRNQGYSVDQVAGQIRRWHPGISPTQARSMVKAAGNPIPHVTARTASPPPVRVSRLLVPVHASRRGGSFLGGIVGELEGAGGYVAHEAARGAHWAERHPDTVATALALATLVAAGPLGVGLELAAGAASAYGARRALRRGDYLGAALDFGAIGVGGGALYARVEERIAGRLADETEQSARSTDRAMSQETRKRELRRLQYQVTQLRASER